MWSPDYPAYQSKVTDVNGLTVQIDIDDREDFEENWAPENQGYTERFVLQLIDGITSVGNVTLEKDNNENKNWEIYIGPVKVYIDFNTSPANASLISFYPDSHIRGEGSRLFRNITNALRMVGVKDMTLYTTSELGPRYFALMGGQPFGTETDDVELIAREQCDLIRHRTYQTLVETWDKLPYGAHRIIINKAEKITPEYLATHPTALADLAEERHLVDGKPFSFHVLNGKKGDKYYDGFALSYLFDLQDPRVLTRINDYTERQIAKGIEQSADFG